MTSIGTALKEARTKKSFTLDEVHSKIKIHPRVLQLLEEEKFDKLPSPLFVKSFLRSYADFLELNPEELLSSYEKGKTATTDAPQPIFLRPAESASRRMVPPFAIVGALLGAALLLWFLVGSPSKAVSNWTQKVKASHEEKAGKKAAKKEERKTSKDKDQAPAAKEKADKKVDSDWLNSPKLGNFPTISSKNPLDLSIKALDAVWLHITVDGQVVYQGILKKGSGSTWKAKESIEVWTGNASNMFLSLNNTSLGSPGKGLVKKMVISHEGIRMAAPIND